MIQQFMEAQSAQEMNEQGQPLRDAARVREEGQPNLDEEYASVVSPQQLDRMTADHRNPEGEEPKTEPESIAPEPLTEHVSSAEEETELNDIKNKVDEFRNKFFDLTARLRQQDIRDMVQVDGDWIIVRLFFGNKVADEKSEINVLNDLDNRVTALQQKSSSATSKDEILQLLNDDSQLNKWLGRFDEDRDAIQSIIEGLKDDLEYSKPLNDLEALTFELVDDYKDLKKMAAPLS